MAERPARVLRWLDGPGHGRKPHVDSDSESVISSAGHNCQWLDTLKQCMLLSSHETDTA